MSVDPTAELQRLYVVRRINAIERTREVCEELIALRNVPTDSVLFNLQEAAAKLKEVTGFLGPPTVEELLVIWKTLKSPDDDTTEEQARAKLVVVCRDNGKR